MSQTTCRSPATLAMAVACGFAAAAAGAVDRPPDALYPLTSALSQIEGSLADMSDPVMLDYERQAGFVLPAEQAAAALEQMLDPSQYTGPDGQAKLSANLQRIVDGVVRDPQVTAVDGAIFLNAGNPYYMVNWSHHPGEIGTGADYRIDDSVGPAVGTFGYPCIADTGAVTYLTRTSGCVRGDTPGADFVEGEARRIQFVDSRGLSLVGTLWLPEAALHAAAGQTFPGVVLAGGLGSRESDYYMYAMTLAEAGMIVFTFDNQGQGNSEGYMLDIGGSGVAGCYPAGACRDLQDAVRWFTGATITAVSNESSGPRLTPSKDPAYEPAGANAENPVLPLLDTTRIGIIGQSMGSLSVIGYLYALSTGGGIGADGRPLPPIGAAVALSGFGELHRSPVPLQLQTADHDLAGASATNGGLNVTDGPVGTSDYFDAIDSSAAESAPLELIIEEGGGHFDTTNVPSIPHAPWSAAVSTSYATAWFSCYLESSAAACAATRAARPHLSEAYASEYDADGSGPAPSRCLNVPDAASVEQLMAAANEHDPNPSAFVDGLQGRPPYSCTPQ